MANKTNNPLNLGQILFQRHFPEILTQISDPETKEYSVIIPLKDGKIPMKIDNYGSFSTNNPSSQGFFTDFLTLAEGIPKDDAFKVFKDYGQKNFPPDMEQIKKWQKNLFSAKGKPVRDYLLNERGLTKGDIQKYFLGYDSIKNELVFPAFNITKQNPITVKFSEFDPSIGLKEMKCRLEGPNCLLGYHRLRFDPDINSVKYITTDELDALILRQYGLDIYCSIGNFADEWIEYFANNKIVIITTSDLDSIIDTRALSQVAGEVNLVKLNVNFVSDYFVREKKTLPDLNEEILKGQKLSEDHFISMDNLREVFATESKTEDINGPQDYSSIGFIYGAVFNDSFYFLTSKRLFEKESDIKNRGILIKKKFEYSGVTKELVANFTDKKKSVKASDVFNAVKEYIKRYIFFKDEDCYDLLTIWAMGTYVFTLFRHYPYVHVQAEKASGKTELMAIMAEICFNGKHFVNTTGAVIFREADTLLRTMFIDEAEGMGKNRSQRDLMALLNSGYQRGVVVPRSAAKGKTVDYSVYCPKMFAGINEINDVLQSRSIQINMLRKLSTEKVIGYRLDDATHDLQSKLREDLYLFGLLYAEELKNIYENGIDRLKNLNSLDNRQLNLWTPMFIIASTIDTENKNDAVACSLAETARKHTKKQTEKDRLENQTIRLLTKLDEVLNKIAYAKKDDNNGQLTLKYLKDYVYGEFNKDKEWKKEIPTKNKLTIELGKCSVQHRNEYIDGKPNNPCYIIDVDSIYEFGKRFNVEFTFNKKSSPTPIYIPYRVIITKDSENAPLTMQILERIKKLNPAVEVIKSKNEKPKLPTGLKPDQRYEYLQKTIVLATRKSPFVFTFPSPGNIVEGMTTLLQMCNFCHSSCTFCYVHKAGLSTPWRKMYTNIDSMKEQIDKEQLVFRAALTLLSAISFYKSETLKKIPKNFSPLIDKMRTDFSSKRLNISNDAEVKKYLRKTLDNKFKQLDLQFDKSKLAVVKKDIEKYYRENMNYKLVFNVSEFSDIVKTDHISKYLQYLMNLVENDKDFRFKFHTQSTNLDDLFIYPGDNRVEITMVFNTDYVINKYCSGTSSLNERIAAAKNILSKKGFLLKVSIEPIITYPGYEEDYKELTERLVSELDLSSDQVKTIKIGCVRIAPALETKITSIFPNAELFSEATPLEKPVPPDSKKRYQLDIRKNIYRALLLKLNDYQKKTFISCEVPELWKELGLDYGEHMKNSVYQYPGI